jgi:TRAP-type C4-dicarboxylate transport system substrate-binding protein
MTTGVKPPRQLPVAGMPRRVAINLFALLAVCVVAAVASPAVRAQGNVTTLKVASFQPEYQAVSTAIKNWAADITKQSSGRLKFEFFWQGSLLSALEVAPGVRDGRADIGFTGAVYIPSRLPLSTIDTIPFMTTNVAAVGRAFSEMYKKWPELQKEYEKNDYVMVGYTPVSINMFYSKKPINTLADLKNMRIRAVGLTVEALRVAGANPVAIAQDQVYDALSKGLLDAAFGAGMDLGVDFNFHTIANNLIDPNYGVWASGVYIMNRGVYDRLPPDLRQKIDDASATFTEKYYIPELKKDEYSRCDKAKKDGAKVSVWPISETEKWKSALGDTARQKWISTASQNGVDGAKFLVEYEGLVRQYEKSIPWSGAAERCTQKPG